MSTGLKLVLQTSFTDTNLPVLLDDPILPTAGALYLFEPAHPANPMAAGVPSSGSALPNIAATQAAAAISGTVSDVTGSVTYAGLTSTKGLLERSSKGGFAVIMSQTVAPASNDGFRFVIPTPILNYLATNPSHDIYASFWARVTRLGNTTMAWSAISFNASPGTSQLLFAFAQDGINYPNGGNRTSFRRSPAGTFRPASTPGFSAPQPMILNIAVSANTGTVDATRYGKALGIGAGGSANQPFIGTGTAADQASGVLYRAYLEDLTLSGRSYATVDALDFAEYTTHVLTAGGRYYGDTYTAPSTIA